MAKIIEKLTESVPSWGARLAYGEKVTVDGHELVPVALTGFGFGGGEGSSELPDGGFGPDGVGVGMGMGVGEGSGGGGGGYAVPIGAYVGGPDGLRFRPNRIALMVVAAPVISAVGFALAQIIRAFRGSAPS